jgi:hypothetical protein
MLVSECVYMIYYMLRLKVGVAVCVLCQIEFYTVRETGLRTIEIIAQQLLLAFFLIQLNYSKHQQRVMSSR